MERIINSSWLLRLLERLRVLALVVQRRQLSYSVVTQVSMCICTINRYALLIECTRYVDLYDISVLWFVKTHTYIQAGASEQFEQVLFSVRPMRLSLKVYDALIWCKAHPRLTSVALAIPAAAATLGTFIAVNLYIK